VDALRKLADVRDREVGPWEEEVAAVEEEDADQSQ
jgi:hypothetical protein